MATDVKQLKAELALAGIEVYRSRKAEIHIAERVRLHIMDSGVRLQIMDGADSSAAIALPPDRETADRAPADHEPGERPASERPASERPAGERLRVTFTARSQRSDFPNEHADTLFEKVRRSVGTEAALRGFVEVTAGSLEVKDPMDDARVLDVWHEVTYEKPTVDARAAFDEIRWALALERCIQR